jgi:hypothetical protein
MFAGDDVNEVLLDIRKQLENASKADLLISTNSSKISG